MTYREPFAIGEWYHCYGRGVDKRKTFLHKRDYERFMMGMYLANGDKQVRISNFGKKSYEEIMALVEQEEPIVEIGAFCLMPNHFHILIKETLDGGIALYMQKLMTGYTMYFNKKNERAGALFSGTFKSRHVPDDIYFKQVVSYIHINPIELSEPDWKMGLGNLHQIEDRLREYRYSSLPALYGINCLEKKILGKSIFDEMYEKVPPLSDILTETQLFFREYPNIQQG